jgi:hypothetical protein
MARWTISATLRIRERLMTPQHYPLWVAQELDDNDPRVGLVIGWHAPQSDADPLLVQDLAPVFVGEGGKAGGSSVFVAADPYFVAATREQAVEALNAHVKPRHDAQVEEAAREEKRRRREAAVVAARDSAVRGELAPLQDAVVDRLRPAIPKLAEVAGEAEWELVGPHHVQVRVKRRRPVTEVLLDWDQDLIRYVTAVLGEGWTVTVNKPGLLNRRR